MREITLKEMQRIELNLLIEFDALCKRHGLKYYIDGGTLLGAMCYEGFIPWDDDIDLKMPRPDYERFIRLGDELPDFMRIETPSKEHCDYLFAKLTDARTLLIENPGEHEKRSGVYVDIFPMDALPDDDEERKKHLRRMSQLNTLFHYSQDGFSKLKTSTSWKMRLKGYIYGMVYTPFGLYKALERTAVRYDYETASRVGLLMEGNAEKECFPKSWLEPKVMLEFEGHSFAAPQNYKEHLRVFYGEHITQDEYYHNLPKIAPNHRHEVYWLGDE